MLRNAIAVLAIVLVIGTGVSASAYAHGGDGGGGDGLRGDYFGGGTLGNGYGGYDNRGSRLHARFRGYEGRDMWGHWGAYYGPMIP